MRRSSHECRRCARYPFGSPAAASEAPGNGPRTRGPLPVPGRLRGWLLVEAELVAVGVLELRPHAPGLPLRRRGELHAAAAQLLVGGVDVGAGEDERLKATSTVLPLALGLVEDDAGSVQALRRHLEPAGRLRHRVVSADLEAELVGIEGAGALLVGDIDSDNADMGDHPPPPRQYDYSS